MRQWNDEANEYDHAAYSKVVELEWLVLGKCPLFRVADPESDCGNYEWNDSEYRCQYIPGDDSWHYAHRCGPLWVERYHIPKKKRRD